MSFYFILFYFIFRKTTSLLSLSIPLANLLPLSHSPNLFPSTPPSPSQPALKSSTSLTCPPWRPMHGPTSHASMPGGISAQDVGSTLLTSGALKVNQAWGGCPRCGLSLSLPPGFFCLPIQKGFPTVYLLDFILFYFPYNPGGLSHLSRRPVLQFCCCSLTREESGFVWSCCVLFQQRRDFWCPLYRVFL
jgi:hypothetical protein